MCIGNKIAPIFYNTMEDSGALPLEMSVDKFSTGDVIDIFPYEVTAPTCMYVWVQASTIFQVLVCMYVSYASVYSMYIKDGRIC